MSRESLMVLILATPNLKSSFRCPRFSGLCPAKNENKKPHPNKNKESFPAEMCLSSPKKAEAHRHTQQIQSSNMPVKKGCVQLPCDHVIKRRVTDYLPTSNDC